MSNFLYKQSLKAIRAQLLTFAKDPFKNNPDDCYQYFPDALLVYENGKIVEVGNYKDLIDEYRNKAEIEEYKDALILPGFIDCHVHYVQSPMIGSFGDTLLDWLRHYTFPMESHFKNKDFCDDVAKMFFKQLLSNGTTTANVFCTTFETSVNAFFEESEKYNTRMIAGKVLQDRNLPDSLKDDTAEQSVKQAEILLQKWHHRGRQLYAVIPRFAPTSSPEQMKLAGELYQKYIDKGVYLHTHLNETSDEIAWVKELYPDALNYTDVYKMFGMLDKNTVFAHTCLMQEEEWQMLHRADCGCAHCPSSNLFLGGGKFKYWEAKNPKRSLRLGLGTDIGGGTDFSILKELGEAYKVGMLQQQNISPIHTFYLATRGGAEALHLEDKIGSIQVGFEADFIVLDLKPSDFVNWRMQFTKNIWEKLFVLQTMGVSDANMATYVAGKKVFDKNRKILFNYANEL